MTEKPKCVRCDIGLAQPESLRTGYCGPCRSIDCDVCGQGLAQHARTPEGYKCLYDATYMTDVPLLWKEKG